MRAERFARVVVALVCVFGGGLIACASTDTQGRLDSSRSRVHSGAVVTDDGAIAYADAVAAGCKEGIADAGDVDDVLYVIRVRLAATSAPGPLLEARARLFLAVDRTVESEASFVEAAQAQPSSTNALALLRAADARHDQARTAALCASPPLEVELSAWGEACQRVLGQSDVQFLLAGADASTPCLSRCRASGFRAVAACTNADCYLRNNKAHEICTATCGDEVKP